MELKPVIIFGAGGLGLVALDIFKSNDVIVYGFLDDDAKLKGTEIQEVTVLGSTQDEGFTKLIGKKCDAFIATDDTALRKNLTEMLKEERQVMPATAVHASASIAPSATISYGTLIGPGAVINSGAKIGAHCVIHAGAVVDYNAVVDDFCQVGARALVGSGAHLEAGAFLGAGAVLVSGLTIGKSSRIGAGSVVVEPVKAKGTVFGNPAKSV